MGRGRSATAPFALAFGLALAPSSAVGATPPDISYTATSAPQIVQGLPRGLFGPHDQTASGLPSDSGRANSSASLAQRIAELRALTGLTTDQVGRLFGVSRRSVHNWINGSAMAPQHEERAAMILSIARVLPGTNPAERRAALLDSSRGTSLFHQLVGVRGQDARLQVPGLSARERIEL